MGSVDCLPLYQVPILAPSSPLVGCPQGCFSYCSVTSYLGLPQWLSGKESACNAGDTGNPGSIPGFRKSPGEGHGNPLQYSCLENPMDRGAWRATRSPWGCKQLDTTEATWHTYTSVKEISFFPLLFCLAGGILGLQ